MALITCPECGKPNVSDSAESCPECGYNIRNHFAIQKQEEVPKEIEVQETDIQELDKERIDKELKQLKQDYQNELKQIEETQRPPKPTLLSSMFTGQGSGLSVLAVIVAIACLIVLFVSEETFSKGLAIAVFILPLIWFCLSIRGYKEEVAAYDNWEYYQKSNLKRKYEELERNLKEYGTTESPIKAYTYVPQKNQLRCPMCGSVDVKRISTLNRSASVAMVGIASAKIGKQYQCETCKHLW